MNGAARGIAIELYWLVGVNINKFYDSSAKAASIQMGVLVGFYLHSNLVLCALVTKVVFASGAL